MRRPRSPDQLLDGAYRFRVNRFRGTALGLVPGRRFRSTTCSASTTRSSRPRAFPTSSSPIRPGRWDRKATRSQGYPVYLDGKLSQESWWYYYLLTLVYKVPEGTWLLVVGVAGRPGGLAAVARVVVRRARRPDGARCSCCS